MAKAKKPTKDATLKAIASLIAEQIGGEAKGWIDAGKLAQMGAAIARMGGEPRVQDFDPNGDQFGFDANMNQPMFVGGGIHRRNPMGGFGMDGQAMLRNSELLTNSVMSAAADAVKAMGAKSEAEELEKLCIVRDKLSDAEKAIVNKRIGSILAAMEIRNEQSHQTKPLALAERPRGYQAGEAGQAHHAPNGIRPPQE
ncbi:MAG: hypothetical protein KGL39_59080 [Patescibacteria group bacterium]|nr:hypothetical protein [Patescibacteria group bacterium]